MKFNSESGQGLLEIAVALLLVIVVVLFLYGIYCQLMQQQMFQYLIMEVTNGR
jgi:hypothetical protein